MGSLRAFLTPADGLVELMAYPSPEPFLGVVGWVCLVSAVAGLALCIRRGNYAPLIVLGGAVPAYLVLATMLWPGHYREWRAFYPAMGAVAAALSLAAMSTGFVRARGNRSAAVLMLPYNALFLFAVLILTLAMVKHA